MLNKQNMADATPQTNEPDVVLVDEFDNPIGTIGKQAAHEQGLLHRAFSVFVFNDKQELMLQQRAKHKYHSPLLWTNTCCSHPNPSDKTVAQAAHRRLKFEMGFSCDITFEFAFVYKTEFENGLMEHEFDHVFLGHYNQEPTVNPDEVQQWRWESIDNIKHELQTKPENYTVWFKIAFEKLIEQTHKTNFS